MERFINFYKCMFMYVDLLNINLSDVRLKIFIKAIYYKWQSMDLKIRYIMSKYNFWILKMEKSVRTGGQIWSLLDISYSYRSFIKMTYIV